MKTYLDKQKTQLEKEARIFTFLKKYDFEYRIKSGRMFYRKKGETDFLFFGLREENGLRCELIMNENIKPPVRGFEWCINLLASISWEV